MLVSGAHNNQIKSVEQDYNVDKFTFQLIETQHTVIMALFCMTALPRGSGCHDRRLHTDLCPPAPEFRLLCSLTQAHEKTSLLCWLNA